MHRMPALPVRNAYAVSTVRHDLKIVFFVAQFEHKITALAAKGDFTFAASKTDIVACQRMSR